MMGVDVDVIQMRDLNALIGESVVQREKWVFAHHNPHGIYTYHHNATFRALFARATVAHIDGMMLILVGRILGLPVTREDRTTYVDWVHPLMANATAHGWRVFFVGGKPGVGDKAAAILREAHSGLIIEVAHGYFDTTPDGAANQDVLRRMHEFRTDVLMVGMGMPRQEKWILENLDQLDVPSILPCGACMDFVAGEIPQPPAWMWRTGLAWVHRFAAEPRRLWKRYLVEPWFLSYLILRDLPERRFKRFKRQ